MDQTSLATIVSVYSDGVTIKLDGEESPREKHYKCNASILFEAGQRVHVVKESGTYIVEYPVGNPRTE